MKLYLIRHPPLQVSAGICYGHSDIDVAANFLDEVFKIQQKLIHTQFDAIFTSPLQRCAKLAATLNIGKPIADSRLMELNFGDWEMSAWDDIPRAVFDEWAHDYAHLAPPNGETFSQLQQRGVAFLEEILAQYPTGNIAIVTHGGMIRTLLAHVLNMPLKGLFRLTIDYGSVTQLEIGVAKAVPKINFVNL